MPRRTKYPKSKLQSQRPISRVMSNFKSGMISGIEATDIPDDALAKLDNVVAYETWLQGRTGSQLFAPFVDFVVEITDNTESLATAATSGELYTANSSAAPSQGDIFMVMGNGDFTSDELAEAKEEFQSRILEFEKARASLKQQFDNISTNMNQIQREVQKLAQQTRGEAKNV